MGTYNSHTDVHNTHRNEFTCWYKCDSSTMGSTISLSNGDRTMTTTTSNAHTWNSVYGTFEVSDSGKHTWTVNITRLDNGTPNYWELGIGVANTTSRGNTVFFC